MSTEFILKFCGLFLGVLARMLLPWLRKLRDGRAVRFSLKYLYSSAGSLILGFILTLVLFPQMEAALDGPPAFEAFFKMFCLAFGFGFGWNGLVLEGGQWAGILGSSRDERKEGAR